MKDDLASGNLTSADLGENAAWCWMQEPCLQVYKKLLKNLDHSKNMIPQFYVFFLLPGTELMGFHISVHRHEPL